MTKWCTRWLTSKYGEPVKVLDVSVVADDHVFGQRDREFHAEMMTSPIGAPSRHDHEEPGESQGGHGQVQGSGEDHPPSDPPGYQPEEETEPPIPAAEDTRLTAAPKPLTEARDATAPGDPRTARGARAKKDTKATDPTEQSRERTETIESTIPMWPLPAKTAGQVTNAGKYGSWPVSVPAADIPPPVIRPGGRRIMGRYWPVARAW